jgi:hypothetical protein
MASWTVRVPLTVALCAALALGVSTLAANEPQPGQPQTPGAAKLKLPEPITITQGVRRIVAVTTPGLAPAQVLKPTDLVCSIGVSYDQAGNQPISPPGSSSGTYSAAKPDPGWVHVTARNVGSVASADGKPQPPTFSVRVLFVYPVLHMGNWSTSSVSDESRIFSYVEQLQPGSAYQYDFHFHPASYRLPTFLLGNITGYRWYNLHASVALDPRNLVREPKSDRMNNNCSYRVNFTD